MPCVLNRHVSAAAWVAVERIYVTLKESRGMVVTQLDESLPQEPAGGMGSRVRSVILAAAET